MTKVQIVLGGLIDEAVRGVVAGPRFDEVEEGVSADDGGSGDGGGAGVG